MVEDDTDLRIYSVETQELLDSSTFTGEYSGYPKVIVSSDQTKLADLSRQFQEDEIGEYYWYDFWVSVRGLLSEDWFFSSKISTAILPDYDHILCLGFAPDASRLTQLRPYGKLQVRDAETGDNVWAIQEYADGNYLSIRPIVSEDGSTVLTSFFSSNISGMDIKVGLWNAADGNLISVFDTVPEEYDGYEPSCPVKSDDMLEAMAPDCQHMAVASMISEGGPAYTIDLYDVETENLDKHICTVADCRSLVFSPNGQLLVDTREGFVTVFDLTTETVDFYLGDVEDEEGEGEEGEGEGENPFGCIEIPACRLG